MALFHPKSRYVLHARTFETIDASGRRVLALGPATPPPQIKLGEHLRKDGQRLDHLAEFYLRDATAFWRICELNDAILPDALAEVDAIEIPAER